MRSPFLFVSVFSMAKQAKNVHQPEFAFSSFKRNFKLPQQNREKRRISIRLLVSENKKRTSEEVRSEKALAEIRITR